MKFLNLQSPEPPVDFPMFSPWGCFIHMTLMAETNMMRNFSRKCESSMSHSQSLTASLLKSDQAPKGKDTLIVPAPKKEG